MGSCKLLPPQQQSSVKSIWKCGRARFNGSQLKRKVGLVRLGESDSRKSGALLLNLPPSFQYGMGPISTSPPSSFTMYTKTFTDIWKTSFLIPKRDLQSGNFPQFYLRTPKVYSGKHSWAVLFSFTPKKIQLPI